MTELQQHPGAEAAFVANLEIERDAFRAIYHTLETEQEALTHGDIDHLAKISKSKIEQFVSLSQLADKRNRHLAASGLAGDKEGVEQWLGLQPETSLARGIWRELLASAEAARLLNEANGVLVNVKMQHNQQALNMLQQAANQAALYDPSGRPATSSQSGRRLDQA